MFCKACGKQIDDDSSFCSYCGTKQSAITQTDAAKVSNSPTTESKTVNVNLSFGRQSTNKISEKKIVIEKYDATYQKETDATVVGIISLLVSIAFLAFGGVQDQQLFVILSIFGFIIRIAFTVWCVQIANRQNRETFTWGLFAFFLPSLALIIIGQLKKLKNNLPVNPTYENHQEISLVNVDDYSEIILAKLPAPFITTKEVIAYKTETLVKYLHEYPESIWHNNYPALTPIYIFQELSKRNVTIDNKALEKLEQFAKQESFGSFKAMINHYK